MTYKIVAVDDEPINLRLIEGFLDDEDYEIFPFELPENALSFLQEKGSDIDVILLDRMMPVVNGMEFLRRIKNTDHLKDIPVIMQTAAAERSQVVEGIEAGVYYYLTKPYDDKVLISLTKAAITDSTEKKKLYEESKQYAQMLGFIKIGVFEFRTLVEARMASTYLSSLFPNPEKVILGISEMLTNAVEHGNLKITYNKKTQLNMDGSWENEILKRLDIEENKNKKVNVHYERTDSQIILKVIDEGNGFDWEEYLEISPTRATDNHGRGIAMSKLMSFDEIKYCGTGNEVHCIVNI